MKQRTVLVLLVVTVLSFLAAPFVEAADPIKASLISGGTRLASLQNPDGGWFFVVGDTDCGAGPGVSCANTFGITALGLVDAWRITKKANVKTKARETGDALVAKFEAGPACDADPGSGADRPFTVDVTFLVQLTTITKDPTYKNVGAAWFTCVVEDFPDGADRADDRIDGRIGQGLNNLGAWDAALDIRAALEVPGRRAYALAELKQVFTRQPAWDVDDQPGPAAPSDRQAQLPRRLALRRVETDEARQRLLLVEPERGAQVRQVERSGCGYDRQDPPPGEVERRASGLAGKTGRGRHGALRCAGSPAAGPRRAPRGTGPA